MDDGVNQETTTTVLKQKTVTLEVEERKVDLVLKTFNSVDSFSQFNWRIYV